MVEDRMIQRIQGIHALKDMENFNMQQKLAKQRQLDRMTSLLNVSENQNINMLNRVGPTRIRPGRLAQEPFFQRRDEQILNIPYAHKQLRPGRIKAKFFQNDNMLAVPEWEKRMNVLNTPFHQGLR